MPMSDTAAVGAREFDDGSVPVEAAGVGYFLEEDHIRRLGGPRTRRNPGAALANRRHQMSDKRYRAAGGAR